MKREETTDILVPDLKVFEDLIALSVDLHNLNAGVQRQFDISIVQWLVLKKIVDQPGLSAGTIAEVSGIHPSTLTPTLTRLSSMNLIHIQERPGDLRRKLLVASFVGVEVCRQCENAFGSALAASRRVEMEPAVFDSVRNFTSTLLKALTSANIAE